MKNILIIFFLSIIGTCSAQNRSLIFKLKNKLDATVLNQEQFELLANISWEYRFARPDSSIYYAKEAAKLGDKLELKKDLAKPYNFIAIALNYKGERLEALAYHQKALAIAEDQQDSVQLAHTYNTMGRLLFEQGMLQKAFSFYTQAFDIFSAIQDSSGLAYVKTSLANLYRAQKNFKKAEQTYGEVLQARISEGDPSRIMLSLIQLGSFLNERKEITKSNYYLIKADSIGRLINDEINLAEINVLLSENLLNKGDLEAAKKIGSIGFNTLETTNNIRRLPKGQLLLGKIYMAEKKYSAARAAFNKALALAKDSRAFAFETESYFHLAEVARKMRNEKEEFFNMNRYLTLKDSALNLALARRVEQVQFELQLETSKKENELLKLRQEKAESDLSREKLTNTLYLALGMFCFGLLIITFYVYRRQRNTNKKLADQNRKIDYQNELLQKQNQQLQEINHEKNTLMSIVAHDLKSPLNRIIGLTTLIKIEGTLTPEQENCLRMMDDVTKSGINLIKDLLDLDGFSDTADELEPETFNLSDTLTNHLRSFRVLADSKGIQLKVEIPNQLEITTDPSALIRIIDNLLSNAIKFSPPDKTVTLGLSKENDVTIIRVKDEGPGFSEEDKKLIYKKFARLSARPTGSESSNGLGLAIVRTLVERLKGTITLVSELNKGSEFIVVIPRWSK